jgi:xylulokinase
VPLETILVLDIGTSSAKAAIFNHAGHLLAEASASYETKSPQAGWFEQSPDDWLAATEIALSRLRDLRDVALLVLTGSMQNLILLNKNGQPLAPAILYSDARATPRFATFNARMHSLDAAMRVGNQIDPLMCSAKLDWLAAESAEVMADSATIHTGAKDYIGYRLTGRHATDATSASTTGLMNLAAREWDAAILENLAVAPHRMPDILPSTAILGEILPTAASRLGLRAGLPVLNGIGDAGAATIGAGIEHPNQTYIYLGTTGWVARIVTAHYPRLPVPVFTLAHSDPGLLIEVAPILSAGDSVEWLQSICLESQPDSEAHSANRPLYLPYLKGERSPFHDPRIRGAFLGLDRLHGPGSMRRAVLEGVALAIRHNLEALGEVRGSLTALGGGASDLSWMQILADITGHAVVVHPAPISATAYGAAKLGAHALGVKFDPFLPSVVLSPAAAAAESSARLFRRYLAASNFLRTWSEL